MWTLYWPLGYRNQLSSVSSSCKNSYISMRVLSHFPNIQCICWFSELTSICYSASTTLSYTRERALPFDQRWFLWMASISFSEGFNNTCTNIKASLNTNSKKKPCYILHVYYFKEQAWVNVRINMDKCNYKFRRTKE